MSKPFTRLIEDHKKMKKMLEEMMSTSTSDTSEREEMLNKLKQDLQFHEEVEEKYLYPTLEKKKSTHDLTLESYQEHHVADVLVKEIGKLDVDDEVWKAKLTVLQENLEHHIKEEEDDLFIKAQKTLSDNALTDINSKIETAFDSRH